MLRHNGWCDFMITKHSELCDVRISVNMDLYDERGTRDHYHVLTGV